MNTTLVIKKESKNDFIKDLSKMIIDEAKKDSDFFDRDTLLINENNNLSNQNKSLKPFLSDTQLKKHIEELLDTSIKLTNDENSNLSTNIFLSNSNNGVNYVNFEVSSSNSYQTKKIIESTIYSYNKDELCKDFNSFCKRNNLNSEQKEYLDEFIKDSTPETIYFENFIYNITENIEDNLDLEDLAERFNPTLDDAINNDYSKDIHTILTRESELCNLFKNLISVRKSKDGYDIIFDDDIVKSIEYKIRFI